jgi:hypothetical protein
MKSVEEEILVWLTAASAATGCGIEILTGTEQDAIIQSLSATYVDGIRDPGWWWMGLKLPYEFLDGKNKRISQVLPSLEGNVHLLPDGPRFTFVYRLKAVDLETIIMDCPGFQYAASAEDGSWLMTENHHDMFYLCRASDALLLQG